MAHARPARITPPPPQLDSSLEPSPTLPQATSCAFFCALPSHRASDDRSSNASAMQSADFACMPMPMSVSSPDLRAMSDQHCRLSSASSEILPQAPSLSQDLSAMPSTSFAASGESADLGMFPPVMQSTTPVLRQPAFTQRRGRSHLLSPSRQGSFDWPQGGVRRFPDLANEACIDAAEPSFSEPSTSGRYIMHMFVP